MAESASSNSQPGNIANSDNHTKQSNGAYCILTRITDASYLRRAKRSYPLTEQLPYKRYYGANREDNLNLAQYYTGLRCLFGKPGNLYDDWKGSFSFAFQVEVFRREHTYAYVLHIVHARSAIEFRFRKIVANPKSHDPFDLLVYHAPLADEFSGQEMARVEGFMHGVLQGYLQVTQQQDLLHPPDFVLLTETPDTPPP